MRFVLALFLLVFASPALAQGADDAPYKDYISLTKALRANGVNPVGVNWQHVEQMCLGLKTEKDPVPYNRCRFNKAVDSADYPDDVATCKSAGRAATSPNYVVGNGVTTVIQPSPAEADVTFDECMRARGWINPRNAGRGRRF